MQMGRFPGLFAFRILILSSVILSAYCSPLQATGFRIAALIIYDRSILPSFGILCF